MKVEISILGPFTRNLKSTIKKKVVTSDHRSISTCVILHNIHKGNNRDEFHRQNVELKKQDTKEHIQYESSYTKLKTGKTNVW